MIREYSILVAKESITKSIFRDMVTLFVISFLIYISRDSTWWTLVTGIMFLLFLFSRVANILKQNNHKFNSKAGLLKWANNLPDDED